MIITAPRIQVPGFAAYLALLHIVGQAGQENQVIIANKQASGDLLLY